MSALRLLSMTKMPGNVLSYLTLTAVFYSILEKQSFAHYMFEIMPSASCIAIFPLALTLTWSPVTNH